MAETPAVDLDAIRAQHRFEAYVSDEPLVGVVEAGCPTCQSIGFCDTQVLLGMVDTLTAELDAANTKIRAYDHYIAWVEHHWNECGRQLEAERDHHAEQASNILSHDIQLQHQVRTFKAALVGIIDGPFEVSQDPETGEGFLMVPWKPVQAARAALAGTSPTPPDVTDGPTRCTYSHEESSQVSPYATGHPRHMERLSEAEGGGRSRGLHLTVPKRLLTDPDTTEPERVRVHIDPDEIREIERLAQEAQNRRGQRDPDTTGDGA